MWECRTIARSPALASAMADGEKVQRPVEIALAEPEVGGGDRRGKAVVERLGQAQPLVHAVPAQADRDLVDAQLAGVEEAQHLDPLEVRLAEVAELRHAVLAQVPRVV